MIIMVTFGIEIFLRGVMPGTFGVAVKRLDLGIPQAPIFLGEMLITAPTLSERDLGADHCCSHRTV